MFKELKKKFKISNTTLLIAIVIFYFINRLLFLIRSDLIKGFSFFNALINALTNYTDSIFSNFLMIDFNLFTLLFSIIITLCIMGLIYAFKPEQKNYKPGAEHGSARFGEIDEINHLKDSNLDIANSFCSSNTILSANIQFSKNTRKSKINNNVMIIGGSGSGKTRFYLKPQLLQLYCNYIVVDPKGSVAEEFGNLFVKNKQEIIYERKILNLVDVYKSMRYNPFRYIRRPNDVFKFVNNLVKNTKSQHQASGGDDFFEKAEIAWMTAVIFYVLAEGKEHEKNFNKVMELFQMAGASEEDENAKSPLDKLFDMLDSKNKMKDALMDNPNKYDYAHLAVTQYQLYLKAAGKTAKSILISVGVRLAIFNLPELQHLLKEDEINLDFIGEPKVIDEKEPNDLSKDLTKIEWMEKYNKTEDDYEKLPVSKLRKTVLFIIISDSDSTYNFLSAIIMQQLYEMLYRTADARKDHRLPIHTSFLLDEFANCGRQDDFEIKIATMRSREISVNVILQNIAQLKNLYEKCWEVIFGNCDTTVYLGGKELDTQEYLSKLIGNTTIDHKSISETKGANGSYSVSNQLIQRALIDPAELSRLAWNECLIHIRGYHIFLDKKFDLMSHPNIEYTTDYASENFFNIGEFLKPLRAVDAFFEGKSTVLSSNEEWSVDEIIKNSLTESDLFGDKMIDEEFIKYMQS